MGLLGRHHTAHLLGNFFSLGLISVLRLVCCKIMSNYVWLGNLENGLIFVSVRPGKESGKD